jgi:hypothetical protein
MLEKSRDKALRRRLERIAKQVPEWDWDEARRGLFPEVRVSTHQEVRDHYVAVVDILKRYGRWNSQRIADFLGVSRQTSYQYGFQPHARGARLVPADKLEALRTAAAAAMDADLKRTFAPGITPEMRTWQVFVGMELKVESFHHLYAESQAARLGGVCWPHNDNAKPDHELSSADQLCVDWLTWRHAGLITKAEAMQITGLDEYLEARVGHEVLPWRIMPTVAQVEAIESLHKRREAKHGHA